MRDFRELTACVDLQIEVWGYSDGDVIPRRAFIVTQKIGGQVFGAFDLGLPGAASNGDAGSLIGFAMALPAYVTVTVTYTRTCWLSAMPIATGGSDGG